MSVFQANKIYFQKPPSKKWINTEWFLLKGQERLKKSNLISLIGDLTNFSTAKFVKDWVPFVLFRGIIAIHA